MIFMLFIIIYFDKKDELVWINWNEYPSIHSLIYSEDDNYQRKNSGVNGLTALMETPFGIIFFQKILLETWQQGPDTNDGRMR